MGEKCIRTSLWRKWLKSKGLVHVRTSSSHEVWDYPDDSLIRPIVFQGAKKEIPIFHIGTNLRTLGISLKQFQLEIQEI